MKKKILFGNALEIELLLVSFYISSMLSLFYFRNILLPNAEQILALHNEIFNGTAPSPYNYRLLATYSIEGISYLTQFLVSIESTSKALSVAIFTSIWLTLFYYYLAKFLQIFHSKVLTFIGLISCGFMSLIVFSDHYHQPWSFSEAAFFAATFYYSITNKWIVLLIITILASSNRVTGIFIPFIYLCYNIKLKDTFLLVLKSNKNVIVNTVILTIFSIITIFIIRTLQGSSEHVLTLYEIIKINTTKSNIFMLLLNFSMFLGPYCLFSFKGYRFCDETHRRFLISISPYFFAILLFGVWKEVRLLLPFYPIFISIGLYYLASKLK